MILRCRSVYVHAFARRNNSLKYLILNRYWPWVLDFDTNPDLDLNFKCHCDISSRLGDKGSRIFTWPWRDLDFYPYDLKNRSIFDWALRWQNMVTYCFGPLCIIQLKAHLKKYTLWLVHSDSILFDSLKESVRVDSVSQKKPDRSIRPRLRVCMQSLYCLCWHHARHAATGNSLRRRTSEERCMERQARLWGVTGAQTAARCDVSLSVYRQS